MAGVMLLGIVQGDNSVALLGTPLEVDEKFVARALETGDAEGRFRFANTCAKSGCKQWDGHQCGVIHTLTEINNSLPASETLKPCSIRERCRWYHQEGRLACDICTYVVTDSMEDTDLADVLVAH